MSKIRLWRSPSMDPIGSLERDLQKLRDEGWIVRGISIHNDRAWPHPLVVNVVLEEDGTA